ncbi:MAG: class I SAM-dependent methyltransferase [Bdellovibrionales bacterium]|nr:class I SAM-dependent methyltransferase [Bdellovibrionales bacterium]
MQDINSRRDFIRRLTTISALMFALPYRDLLAAAKQGIKNGQLVLDKDIGNFAYIYGNDSFKQEFYPFLINVFHLFPEKEMHQLIDQVSQDRKTDREIYRTLQSRIHEIKPMLGDLTFALPALKKQKEEMGRQAIKLLKGKKTFSGYFEIGTTGRYIGHLEDILDINGPIFLSHEKAATYSPVDIVERGQLSKIGEFVPLNNYEVDYTKDIPKNSIDLATVYIGFHHCPVKLRDQFLSTIRDILRPGGQLIVRDHNVFNEKMWRIVALAHDIFNMGTNETLAYNESEIRKFYSHEHLDQMMLKNGFKTDGIKLYQQGDPTLNGLMLYTKA